MEILRLPDSAKALSVVLAQVLFVPLAGALAGSLACGDSSTASGSTLGSSDTSGSLDTDPIGDPNAPGQDCPEAFDPNAVYVVLQRAGFVSDAMLLANVEEPESECAFTFSDGAGHAVEESNFGVRSPDGQLLRISFGYTGDLDDNSDGSNLHAMYPDPLEQIDGVWGPVLTEMQNDDLLARAVARGECGLDRGAAELMTYGPTGELGILCRDQGTLNAFDGRLLSAVPSVGRLVGFIDDGRALVINTSGLVDDGRLEIVPASGDGEPVPVVYDSGADYRIEATQRVDGDLHFVASLDGGASGSMLRLRLDGEALVLVEEFPAHDLRYPQYAMDASGRVTALGPRNSGDAMVVMRLDGTGNRVVYEFAELDDDVPSMPESSGAMRIDRLLAPP